MLIWQNIKWSKKKIYIQIRNKQHTGFRFPIEIHHYFQLKKTVMNAKR